MVVIEFQTAAQLSIDPQHESYDLHITKTLTQAEAGTHAHTDTRTFAYNKKQRQRNNE